MCTVELKPCSTCDALVDLFTLRIMRVQGCGVWPPGLIHGAQPHNLENLKDLVRISWCHTFRGLVVQCSESELFCWHKVDLHNIYTGGFEIVADWCKYKGSILCVKFTEEALCLN